MHAKRGDEASSSLDLYCLLANVLLILRHLPLDGCFAHGPGVAEIIAVGLALVAHVHDVHVELAVRLGEDSTPAVGGDGLGTLIPLHLQLVGLGRLGVGNVRHDGVLVDGLEVLIRQGMAGPGTPILLDGIGSRGLLGDPGVLVEGFAQSAVGVDHVAGQSGIVDLQAAVVEGAAQGVLLAGVGRSPHHAVEAVGGVGAGLLAQLGEVHAALLVVIPGQTAGAVPHGHGAFRGCEEVHDGQAQLGIRSIGTDGPDAVAAQVGHAVHDGVGLVRHAGVHHLTGLQMLLGVENHGGSVIEDAPVHAAVLHLGAHLIVGLGHGVGIQKIRAVELIEELPEEEERNKTNKEKFEKFV